jgi:hypothetical protein
LSAPTTMTAGFAMKTPWKAHATSDRKARSKRPHACFGREHGRNKG